MNLLLLLVLGLAGAFPLEDKVCQPHSRPWQVRLHGEGVSCSGALINEYWVVTSLHCAPRPYSTVATLGDHDEAVDEGTEQHIKVAEVFYHGPYVRSPLHSLSMARLSQPARFNQYVQPIPLPSRCARPGETCQVSGWGSTSPNQNGPFSSLKCLSVPVVDDQTCMKSFPEYVWWSEGMVCAGRANTDNCLSGNTNVMVCDGQLQGVTWFNYGCDNPANPTVYTKLCLYRHWINDVMDNFIPAPTPTMMEAERHEFADKM